MYVCCTSGMVDIEAKTPHGTCTYVDESCIRGHYVSKHFCTPVINEVCSGSQGGKFEGRTCAQKTPAIARCYYTLELLRPYTVRAIIIPMTYSRVDSKIVSYIFSYMAVHLHVEACTVITKSNLIQGNICIPFLFKYCSQCHLIYQL